MKEKMKNSFIRILLLAFISMSLSSAVVFYPVMGSPLTTIYVSPSTSTVGVGQTFTINIEISGVTDLYGWEFKIGWNPTLLDAVDIIEGNFLKSRGETYFIKQINNTVGYIHTSCILLGEVPGGSGSGTLATVKFYAETVGESILDLYDTELCNSFGQPIPHTTTDGNVIVKTTSVGGIALLVDRYGLPVPPIGLASTNALMKYWPSLVLFTSVATVLFAKRRGRSHQKKHRFSRKLKYGLALTTILFSIPILYSLSHPSASQNVFLFKAAIIDQLSISQPNQTFIRTCTTILHEAGFTVDYYRNEEVTLELYQNLPLKGYGLIILRVHSGNNQYDRGPVFLWTSEPYNASKYIYEQLTYQIAPAVTLTEGGRPVFCIGPEFVRQSMEGQFQNTIIIAMGCETLKDTDLAKAFVEKGASIFIGWSEDVAASYTDATVIHLIENLIIKKLTVNEAMTRTTREVGRDSTYNSMLLYYPDKAADYTI